MVRNDLKTFIIRELQILNIIKIVKLLLKNNIKSL